MADARAATTNLPLLVADGLGKTYGRLAACEDISFVLYPGEVIGSGTVVGDPRVRAGAVVRLDGIGRPRRLSSTLCRRRAAARRDLVRQRVADAISSGRGRAAPRAREPAARGAAADRRYGVRTRGHARCRGVRERARSRRDRRPGRDARGAIARNHRATRCACARRSNGCSRACRGCAPMRSAASSTGRSCSSSTVPAAAPGRSRPEEMRVE